MLFVFFDHFISSYSCGIGSHIPILYWVGKLAAPTFITISGLTLGYNYQINGDNFGKFKAKLIDRGLFLLTISHLIMTIAHIPHIPKSDSIYDSIRWEHNTDTIGFCMIVGSLLIDKINPIKRLALSLSIYLVSWLVILFIHPKILTLMILKDTFFGPYMETGYPYYYIFPLLPWFSFYLVNSYVGEKIAIYSIKKEDRKISKMLLTIACLALVSAIFFKTGYLFFKTYKLFPNIWTPKIYILTTPFRMLPPSPIYLLTYGGVGYFILFILYKFRNESIICRYKEIMSVFGKTSLFVFIFQFYVYYVILYYANLTYSMLWPIYFIISVIFIYAVAKIWYKNNLNRFITIGCDEFFVKVFWNKAK